MFYVFQVVFGVQGLPPHPRRIHQHEHTFWKESVPPSQNIGDELEFAGVEIRQGRGDFWISKSATLKT